MPEPRQVEEGEVEDGEVLPPTGPRNSGHNTHYQSGNVFPNGAMKKPSIQIGLNKLTANRGSTHKPSLLEDDSSAGSTPNRVSLSGSGWNIKGAAVTATSTSETTTSGQPNASGINIKGRSGSSSNGDQRLHDSENNKTTSEPSSKLPTEEASFRPAAPISQLSIKGANGAGLPNKPASMALPFKMKSAAPRPYSKSPGPMSSTSHPYQSSAPYQAPSNAIGKGYGNAMLVPKMMPPPPAPVSGPSFTPPPRSNNFPRPPSPSQRPPSPPPRRRSPTPPPPPLPPVSSSLPSRGPSLPFLPARPPTPQIWSDTLSNSKGKAKERPELELEDGEEGEEFEEGEEPVKIEKEASNPLFSNEKVTPNIKSSPNRGGRSVASNRTVERTRYEDDDDDRRRASFGRSQGDRWESSYRSPRRYNDRDYESSSRRTDGRDDDRRSRRRDDDRDSPYRRKSGYDSYDDDDRHRSYRSRDAKDRDRYDDRDGKRHRDYDHDADYKHGRDRDYDRERHRDDRPHHTSSRHAPSRDKKGNVWRRGSSYSPNSEERHSSRREPDFHDEPGAPRHFDRELASTRKSLPSTPSLPAKPVAGLPERPGGSRRDAPPIVAPVPQAATPFFLATPPPSAQDQKPKSPWDDELDATAEMDMGEVKPAAESAKVEAKTFTLFGASPLDRYILEEKLGEGTFGVVHKARRKEGSVAIMPLSEQDRRFRKAAKRRARHGKENAEGANLAASRVHEGDVVALKKIVMHNDMDGVPITALREIRILKTLSHPNVVPVVDMAFQSGDYLALRRGAIYMVFPYMAHDLAGLLENKKIVALDQALLKLYAKQLLLGTSYLHRNKILHRDMKAANLLLSNDGVLQIADFGLARSVETSKEGKRREYTNCVVTRWYRPPELLLGLRAYGPPIDMWGVGCVIGEMFFRHPIFTGSSDLDQISRIVQMCGPIDDETMPGWDKLPEAGVIQVQRVARNVRREFSRFSDDLSDLLDKLLIYNPDTRLTADQALDHDWFWTEPLPAEVGSVQAFPSSHEYDKRKAAEERQGQGGEKARAAQAAAFKGANHVVRAPAVPVQQPVHVQPPPPMPVMQANPWGNNHQQAHRQPNHMHHHQAPMNMPPSSLPLRPGAGLPPRPVTAQVPVSRGYPTMAPMAAYTNGMGMMQSHVQPMSFNHASSMQQQHQEPFLPPAVRAPIAGRSNDPWGQADPAAKRPRLASPPGRLKIAGRSSMSNHADNLGGAGQSFPQHAGQRRGASAYDTGVPAGSAEPLD